MLAGSAGAGSAVQAFLNSFEAIPPVAFIYVQHYESKKQSQLQQLTAENPAFTMVLGVGEHNLAPGQLIIIPPQYKVSIDKAGKISSTKTAWEGEHTPDIEELLIIFSAANLPGAGVIFFSGMGRDGTNVLNVLDAGGTRIWAQAPESAICSSMPQAAIDTGLVHRIDTPKALANEIVKLYLPKS